ncbi:MAG TPA: flagellar export chaperone FliS [Clostridia bacterium]|nr:flagellar export chaperone FliS [Clostridia bacterium]
MAMLNPYQQYQNQSAMTANPGELTLMLYNGLIKFINLAKAGIDNKDIEKSNNAIIRAQDIIQELSITLNMDYEISNSLGSLYDYIYNRLVDANLSKDKAPLDESMDLIVDLRDTWAEAIKINRRMTYGQG